MELITASNLKRAFACPGHLHLPHQQETTKSASRGHNIHEFLYQSLQVGTEAALREMPTRFNGRTTCTRIRVSRLWEDMSDRQGEVTYQYDTISHQATILGSNLHRAYGNPNSQRFIVGTADLIGTDNDTGYRVIADYKAGQTYVRLNGNLQMMFLAACESLLHPASSYVITRIIQLDNRGNPSIRDHDYSRQELNDFLIKLQNQLDQIVRTTRTIPGDHCQWCPASSSCSNPQTYFPPSW